MQKTIEWITKKVRSRYAPREQRGIMKCWDLVTEDFFNDQLESLPPKKTKRIDNKMVAFMVWEPDHHIWDIPRYATFWTFDNEYVRLWYMTCNEFDELWDVKDIVIVSSIL